MPSTYLSISNIHKSFGAFSALENINLDIHKNEFVCLLGPSGCGKTTLLRILAGLESPNQGSITVEGRDITSLPPFKRKAGMMFQSYALFPNLTAKQNIAYGLKEQKMSKSDLKDKINEVLSMVDLQHVADKYPAEISGGQQQRVALARAIALSPDFLLLDEPLSALDAKVRERLRKGIRRLHEDLGMTTIMVTHDQEEALTMADTIVVMNHANIIQVGSPEEIYEQPKSRFVADFIGAVNFVENDHVNHYNDDRTTELAIRPEHVIVSVSPTRESKAAWISEMEFRGAFYRVSLTLDIETNSVQRGHVQIVADIPVAAAKKQQLKRGMKIYVELPHQHLMNFGSPQVERVLA
ncbi:iron(III) transport system ATP-binding protein [Paenibacillus shirakamiensis]|uniref:Iron(III) transport system ATP-binding protein n=1 Tax=Paenibacillus shirakamiensis TaxID=1265935 RepID=A0ABS4JF51_9BACL|nr:ATP-binding cassette domain-containing protein [Paenibacillus shirakamiensis]MBP2000340.1 iron(III) transport system ATP-binding protein [Paenibacillus shirakamiensis]